MSDEEKKVQPTKVICQKCGEVFTLASAKKCDNTKYGGHNYYCPSCGCDSSNLSLWKIPPRVIEE